MEPDSELDRQIAEQVFGYRRHYPGMALQGVNFYHVDVDGRFRYVEQWSSDISCAWRVVERIAAQGWHWRVTSPFDPRPEGGDGGQLWWAGCTPWSTTGWN